MGQGLGFKVAQAKLESKGVGKEDAGAILAAGAREASKSAKAKNPALKRVPAKKK